METNTAARHRADRDELAFAGVDKPRMNPWAKCTGSAGGHHTRPCPQHHPMAYAKTSPRRWKHRGQAVRGVAS